MTDKPKVGPGDYYDRKAEKVRHWTREIEQARARGASEEEIRWLETRREEAGDTGD